MLNVFIIFKNKILRCKVLKLNSSQNHLLESIYPYKASFS